MRKPGRFVTLEGSEGAGKSTLARTVRIWLEAHNRKVVITREPGGTPVAEELRKLLLDTRNRGLCDTAELLLMFASRAQHVNELIVPKLKAGWDVVCDRFSDASYAYQGGGRWRKLPAMFLSINSRSSKAGRSISYAGQSPPNHYWKPGWPALRMPR